MKQSYRNMVSFVILLAVTGLVLQEARADFSRYQVILDRRPFGHAPVEETRPEPRPQPAGPSFVESLRLVAMTISQGDIRVGFVDNNSGPPQAYFLFVGEVQDGIRVVSADYDAEMVVLEKDGVQGVLQMGGGASARGAGMLTAGRAPERGGASDGGGGGRRGRPVPRVISEGRRIRMEEEQRRAEMVPELTGAVLDRHLQEYNLQAIREGMPPLPIPLTPEQDAQLVAEGVLPALEE
jgi:hypothetical protein